MRGYYQPASGPPFSRGGFRSMTAAGGGGGGGGSWSPSPLASLASATIVNTFGQTDDARMGTVKRMFVEGDYLYAAVGSKSLLILDVSDIMAPSVVGAVDAPIGSTYGYQDAAKSGDTMFIVMDDSATNDQCIKSFDVSDPTNPTLLDELTETEVYGSNIGGFPSVAARGDYVFVTNAGSTYPFRVIDASDPSNMTVVGSLDLTLPYREPRSATVIPGTDYVIVGSQDNSGRHSAIIDVSTKTSPTVVGHLDHSFSDEMPRAFAVTTDAQTVFVAFRAETHVEAWDISDPTTPLQIGGDLEIGSRAEYNALATVDGQLYMAGRFDNEIHLMDVSDPAAGMSLEKTFTGVGIGYSLAPGDGWIAVGDSGEQIYFIQ